MSRGSVHDLLHPKTGQCKLSYVRKFSIAKQTAQGMNWLHQIEPAFLHLDLKPHNLLVDENWVVKVSDFGLSRMKNGESTTVEGLVGSPMYMSPEMMLGKPATTKSDVYRYSTI
jgi:serine/threonine protein kinase